MDFSPEESLKVIRQTIDAAKHEVQENGFYFLFWGILVVIAGLADFYQSWQLQSNVHAHYAWMVLPVAGVTGTIVYEMRRKRKPSERNTFNQLYGMVWLGYGISLPLLVAYSIQAGMSPTPVILIMTGFAVFISGGVLHFRPVLYGAVVIWGGGMLTLFTPEIWQSFIMAVAVGLGYLVPGYLLNRQKYQ